MVSFRALALAFALAATSAQAQEASYATSKVFLSLRANGTARAPAPLVSGDLIAAWGAGGWNGATWTTQPNYAGGIDCSAAETWSPSAQGTLCRLLSTPIGSLTPSPALRWLGPDVQVGRQLRVSFTDGIVAAGTSLATATVLTSDINYVTTVASGTGVSLTPYNATLGGVQRQEVFNEGANALAVYPAVATTSIKSGTTTATAGVAVSIASGGHATFTCVSATLCRQGP